MKVLIAIFIGAIIGYITNYLAIKMLFKPYSEKKFLGIKIPFTPGLIPKEKPRIAKSVGEAIGKHLLTKEALVKSLCSKEMNIKLNKWIKQKLIKFKNSNYSMHNILKKVFPNVYNNLTINIKSKILDLIYSELNREETKVNITKFIYSKLNDKLNNKPEVLLNNSTYMYIKNSIINKLLTLKENEIVHKNIEILLNEKLQYIENSDLKLKDIIPSSFIDNLKVYIFNKRSEISLKIKDVINSDDNKEKIYSLIGKLISDNLNPMISMFLSNDVIYSKIINFVNEFIEQEENQKSIAIFLNNIVDLILDNSASDIINNISIEGKNETLKSISNFIVENFITSKNINRVIGDIEKTVLKKDSISHVLSSIDNSYNDKLYEFIYEKVDTIIESEEVRNYIREMIDRTMSVICDKPISEITSGNESKVYDIIIDSSNSLYNKFIEKGAPQVIETLNISKIVEDKINSFDVAFAEKIIVEIAHKELNAITWLGAVLGGTMGLISALISTI